MSLALVLSIALSQAPVSETPAPEAAPAAAPAATVPAKHWYDTISFSGYARLGVFYVVPFRNDDLVGSNGGFRMADLRLEVSFRPVDKFVATVSVDGSAPIVDPLDPLSGQRVLALKDAFVEYDFCKGAHLQVGQFRPQYYAEMLTGDALISFVSRSLLAYGVSPPEGYGPRTGLAPDRQVGLQLASARLGDTFGLRYAAGVYNGNGLNQLFNDNNGVMPVGRVAFDYNDKVSLGLNASYNVMTSGPRTARLNSNQLNYGADVTAKVWRLDVMAGFLGRRTSYSFPGLPSDSSMGAMGQVHYLSEKWGLEAGVRFAWLEPSTAQTDDQVTELAAMVGWRPFKLPFRVLVQYTHRGEEPRVAIANDSIDAMLHANW
jgi:hypothetical protein